MQGAATPEETVEPAILQRAGDFRNKIDLLHQHHVLNETQTPRPQPWDPYMCLYLDARGDLLSGPSMGGYGAWYRVHIMRLYHGELSGLTKSTEHPSRRRQLWQNFWS